MWKALFADGSLFTLPIVGMCIFIAIFLAVLVRVMQRSRKPQYDHMSTLPLDDDAGEGVAR
ncbi:MAG: cbb3-type cytochrome c oxidase subunit 3 [bacterium]|nr:cbb3-type cytochrome c oxidase subunit 3 [bacterium]